MPGEKILMQKKEVVNAIKERLSSAKSVILADYRGLTVEQDTELRRALRQAGVDYSVVKNTLTLFAAKETGYEKLEPFLNGPTAIALSKDDAVASVKVLTEYAKKFEKFQIKAGVVEGSVFNADEIKAIAALPSKEQLVAKVLGSFNAPITGFVNVLSANMRGLVVALNAIAEKKAG